METSGSASSQFITTGLSGVEMAKIKLASTVEDMKVERLEVRSIKGDGNIASVKLLGTGLTTDPTVAVTNGTAVFTFASGSEVVVPAYGSRVLTVAVDTTNVGTITAGQMGTIGFATMNARGSGSGNTVQETIAATTQTAGTNDADGAADFTAGDMVYFTVTGTAGTNSTSGYYMVTTTTADNLDLVATGIALNGGAAATTFNTGDKVTKLTATTTEIDADADSENALAVGDVVYFYDASAPANSAWHIVTTASTANSANITLDGTATAVAAGDGIAKFAATSAANALVGNTMRFEEVEPVVSVTSGTWSRAQGSEDEVARFDVKASGSRDMTFNAFTLEKGGSNVPSQYVTHFSLWNGTNKLAEVATTSAVGATAHTTTAQTTLIIKTGATAAINSLGNISAAEYAKWNVGDTLIIADGTNTTTTKITAMDAYADGCTITVDTAVTLAVAATVNVYDNRVHFDASSDTVALAEQSITAGQTMTLTVKADTTAVKTGLGAGVSATFFVAVPGTTGPITTAVGGINWDYTPLNTAGAASYKTQADGYPVNSTSLSY